MTLTTNLRLSKTANQSDNWYSDYVGNLDKIDAIANGIKHPRSPGEQTILYAYAADGSKIPALKLLPQSNGTVVIQIGRAGDTVKLKTDTYGSQSQQAIPFTLWEPGRSHFIGDKVRQFGLLFECIVDHRSSSFQNDLEMWICLTSGAGIVSQAGHGLTAFNVIRYNLTAWEKAIASTVDTLSEPPTLVISAGTDYFLYSMTGIVELSNTLTPGQTYFLSETVAGALTDTLPTTISNPICRCLDSNKISILSFRATEVV